MIHTALRAGTMLARSLRARARARETGLAGMEFDTFGRKLALREMVERRRLGGATWKDLVNPVSSVRYFEFDFVAGVLDQGSGVSTSATVLDVSSPRLLPFWMAEKRGLRVTMINPDPSDVERSRAAARYVRAPAGLEIHGEADATGLPFDDGHFDLATSVSVIEHVAGDGDLAMMRELVRVVRPGGRIILTFPAKPEFELEYREAQDYATQQPDPERGGYFFQRFYDEAAISSRLMSQPEVSQIVRQYFAEEPPGFFSRYEKKWMRKGLDFTAEDPWLMARHFVNTGEAHPSDRMAICGLALKVARIRESG